MNIDLFEISEFEEINPPEISDNLVNIPYDPKVYLWENTTTRWRKSADGLVRDYDGEADWRELAYRIGDAIREYVRSGEPAFSADAVISGPSTEVERKIVSVIDKIRPAVQQDGGDIIFISYDDGIVNVQMQGACSGCPSSTATLKGWVARQADSYPVRTVRVSQRQPCAAGMTSTRTRVVPARRNPSWSAARRETSMIRPLAKGPRSLTVSTTDL